MAKLNSLIDELISEGYTPEEITKELAKAQRRAEEKKKKEEEAKAKKEQKEAELKTAKHNLTIAFATYLSITLGKTFTQEGLKKLEKVIDQECKYLEEEVRLINAFYHEFY